MTNNQLTDPQAPVSDEELDQMIWKLERDGGMTPKMLSLMRELREVRRANSEKLNQPVSETETLPSEYLQGHQDGLEWAAQMAEANHPQTGDWLYDDPIALAAAIRKGPDMPLASGNSPATPDGWIPVSERIPDGSEEVLCAKEFDGPGDWRQKVGYRLAGKWTVYGASWTPTHWQPLPAAPKEVG